MQTRFHSSQKFFSFRFLNYKERKREWSLKSKELDEERRLNRVNCNLFSFQVIQKVLERYTKSCLARYTLATDFPSRKSGFHAKEIDKTTLPLSNAVKS